MAFTHFLAMTSAEFSSASSLPEHIGWMACHFSPYATGLSNLPERLPEGSLLILNDRTPIRGHDPQRILEQLIQTVDRFHCYGILLDFQQKHVDELSHLAAVLCRELPCPVCATAEYSPEECPVFLPPLPTDQPAESWLTPWQGREIWLETALSSTEILLTPNGAQYTPFRQSGDLPHRDSRLYCHYRIDTEDSCVRFSIRRTQEDLDALLSAVQNLGITTAVGLYQELG